MNSIKNFNIIAFLAVIIWSAASISNPIFFQVNNDAEIIGVDGKTRVAVRKGVVQKIEKNQPVTVVSAGKIPMVIVPVESSSSSNVSLSLIDVKDWPNKTTQEYLDKALNEIMEESIQIQILIQSNRSNEALAKIEVLENKYPKMAYLNFFKASAYVLQGKKSLAVKAVKSGLEIFPKNEEGLKLLKALGGSQ